MVERSQRELTHRIYREAVLLANRYKAEVTQAMREVSHELGLSGEAKFAQYDVMCELYHEGTLTPSQIAESIEVTLPNVLTSVNGLVDLGLAEKTVDPADRRRSTVRLTELGARFGDEIMERHARSASAMAPDRTSAERLLSLLERYKAASLSTR